MKREKIIQNFLQFVRNEEAGLKRLWVLKRVSRIGGWAVLLISFSVAFQEPSPIPSWVYTMTAAFGGAMIGLGIWFDHTLASWPVLRLFIDMESVRSYEES